MHVVWHRNIYGETAKVDVKNLSPNTKFARINHYSIIPNRCNITALLREKCNTITFSARYLHGGWGISLGVDLVPMKTCTLNCIYCECGESTHLTLERREYVPFDTVRQELSLYFENNPVPDYITFSGSGEPTLNSRIGDVLHVIKSHFHNIPTAVLTNGTLFSQKQVREDIKAATVIIPSLDAATEKVFRKINRPISRI